MFPYEACRLHKPRETEIKNSVRESRTDATDLLNK